MAKVLLLSNGHGEDLSGAIIAKHLNMLGHKTDALPLVGKGNFYSTEGIKIIGKTKEFSTGGIGYTSLRGRFQELIQGQILYLISRIITLIKVSNRYDLVVAVGDIVPILSAWLIRLPVVTYLVAYSSHYEGRLKLPWPVYNCLSSSRFYKIFSRDELTADDLSNQLRKSVVFLGNPFMDKVFTENSNSNDYRLAILPGSRRPELDNNLLLLLKTISFLPDQMSSIGKLSIDIALVSSMDNESLEKVAIKAGWKFIASDSCCQLIKDSLVVNLFRNRFVEILQGCNVVMSMAGTAAEQAVGLAKPVIQLPGYGPQFTPGFAEAQRRLLGPTVFCSEVNSNSNQIFFKTAELVKEILVRIQKDLLFQKECINQAKIRLGVKGGGRRMAFQISKLLGDLEDELQ